MRPFDGVKTKLATRLCPRVATGHRPTAGACLSCETSAWLDREENKLSVKKLGRLSSVLAVAIAAVVAFGAVPAQAATDTLAEQTQVVGAVLTAGDPTAAYNALSPTDQALFQASLNNLDATTVVDEGGVDTAAAASGCWYWYWYLTWSDLGYTEGSTWMQLNWCGSGGHITSHSLGTHGGLSQSLGFSYDGVVGTGGLNAGWEYRQYVEFKFIANIGPLHQTLNPCMQIRGGATGLKSLWKSCNLG